MRVQCPNCGGPHPKWECRKPLKEAHDPQIGRVGVPSPPLVIEQPDEPNGETERSLRPSQGGSVGGTGRSLFDKKAYQREYMRKKRAKDAAIKLLRETVNEVKP